MRSLRVTPNVGVALLWFGILGVVIIYLLKDRADRRHCAAAGDSKAIRDAIAATLSSTRHARRDDIFTPTDQRLMNELLASDEFLTLLQECGDGMTEKEVDAILGVSAFLVVLGYRVHDAQADAVRLEQLMGASMTIATARPV